MMDTRHKYLRWSARILSLLIGGGFVLILIIISVDSYLEGNNRPPEPNAILQLSISGAGCLSMILAWKWEFAGGIISILFFIALGFVNPETFPLIQALFMPAGILFVISSVMNKVEERNRQLVH